jgi:diguanylate cyclase (GGDEF)-like protein/PAS domain S-box-containing protein
MNSTESPVLDIAGEAERQKTALLYLNAGIAFLVTFVNASLIAWVNAAVHTPATWAATWWGVMVCIAVGRYILARRFPSVGLQASAARQWRRRYVIATGLAACVWGAGAILFMWGAPAGTMMFSGMVLAGMVAGAVPILAPVRSAFLAFALPVLLPVATISLLQADSMLHGAFGFVTVVFIAAVLASARFLHGTLDVAIRLNLEQGRLVRDMETVLAKHELSEKTLAESEQRYLAILQCSPTGIFHYDSDLVITYCNERICEILGTPMERLVGLEMRNLHDKRVLPALDAALQGNDGLYEGEYVTTLSGKQIWVSMACTPLRLADGRIEGGIAIVEDITSRHRSEDEIRHLAYFDPLTRLPNRRLLMDRLGHAMTTSGRSQQFGALMILDMDNFKSLNDTQGHDIGDRLLIEVAHRLLGTLRVDDTVARLGGDEYVVLVEALEQNEGSAASLAEEIAEKVRLALNQPYVLGGGETEYFSTTSIGVTLFRGQDVSADVLLKQADVALYQAKGAGRDAVRFFSPSMQAAIDSRIALETALRRGLAREEFRLYYQPQVDLGGRLIGAEALVRWKPRDQELISPALFIPLAEETGLILDLGQWVLETACRQIAAWQATPETHGMHVSVNVSARQFRQTDFAERVRQCLLATKANPAFLTLEITEGVVLDDIESVIQRMREIDQLGVRFSLDDFGTGYSSLSYLKRLPLAEIKIDASFVRDIPGDANDAAIVRAILAMSQTLGLHVIAEGVENTSQREFLLVSGCQAYQGYLFGRPMPIEEWNTFIASSGTKH